MDESAFDAQQWQTVVAAGGTGSGALQDQANTKDDEDELPDFDDEEFVEVVESATDPAV